MRTSLSKSVSPVEFVLAENLHRRHLKPIQRGVIIASAQRWAERGRPEKSANLQNKMTTEKMADVAQVSPRTIETAKRVVETGRSEEVISGEKSASAVIQEDREKVVSAEREEVETLRDDLKDGGKKCPLPERAVSPNGIDLSLCKPYKRNHDSGDPTKHYKNVLRGDQSGRFPF